MIIQVADESWSLERNDNIIFSKSIRVPRLIKSTFAAELEAATRGLVAFIRSYHSVHSIFEERPSVRFFTDSRALYLASKSGETKDPFSAALLKFYLQESKVRGVVLEWVPTTDMKADCTTKIMMHPPIYQHGATDELRS